MPNGEEVAAPAFVAGLKVGDRLFSINGKVLKSFEDVPDIIKASNGKALKIVWSRQGKLMNAILEPAQSTQEDPMLGKDSPGVVKPEFRIGIGSLAMADASHYFERSFNPITCIKRGLSETWYFTSLTAQALYKLVTGKLDLKMIGSPYMIYKIAGGSYKRGGGGYMGWYNFLHMLCLLSVTLGIFNLLPIPVLDGGHAVFFFIEWIRGKPVSLRAMEISTQVGLVGLLCFMVVVFYNDIVRYSLFDNLLKMFR
jgi:regulator of sigma E protease